MFALAASVLLLLLVLGLFYLIGSIIVKETSLPHGDTVLRIFILVILVMVIIGLMTGEIPFPLFKLR